MAVLTRWTPPAGGAPYDAVFVTSPMSTQAAVVLLHGAQVVSYTVHGHEVLFMSSVSATPPFRGGIPLVWPQFGTRGPLPKHGVARTSTFMFHASGEGWCRLFLPSHSSNLAASLSVTISVEDDTSLTISTEAGAQEHQSQIDNEHILFHAYLRTSYTPNASVRGLAGSVLESDGSSSNDVVSFASSDEVDQVHACVHWPVCLYHNQQEAVRVHSSEPHCVVWNPGTDKAQTINDLGQGEHNQFVCVEPGFVQPGKNSRTAWATFTPVKH